ncbi:hypothetical protein [Alteromonas facilis]|uniref:hypothetical protein n=1 Tax=Alteromonas facilis TaxID=2048004 RepID=UPI000C2852A4|nr:hypothetical protein [Alteromonas facilis]
MTRLSTLKAAVAVTLLSSVGFAANAHDSSLEQYLDSVVANQVAVTKYELNNGTSESVANIAYRFELDSDADTTLVATVKVTELSEAQARKQLNKGAE